MNKQEAIETLQSKAINHCSETRGWTKRVELDLAIDIINQFNEPEKPIVPQFVADWYEDNKGNLEYNLAFLIKDYLEDKIENDKLKSWFDEADKRESCFDYDYNVNTNKPIQTLVNMHQFGYEVQKKEKLYTVEIPDPNNHFWKYTYLQRGENGVKIDHSDDSDWSSRTQSMLTEAEIKQDFEWAWQWAEEVTE